jgi:hypothetical protein
MTETWHPDESQLVPLVDGELHPAEATRLEQHVARCPECRDKVAAYRSLYGVYRSTVRATAPTPPQPWADLRSKFHELDAGRVLSRRQPSFRVNRRWMAVAASVLIGALVVKLATDTKLSAAELLRSASAAEVRSTPTKKIRVKTRKAIYVRPATRGAESELASLFRRANYNWDEPLSARSFAAWRDALPQKDDTVRVLNQTEWGRERFYRITTSTPQGELAEASITIRAADMRAVQEELKFRNDELVEITEAGETVETPSAVPSAPPDALADQPRPAARPVTASDELKVVAALHAIGADLGDPVEVKREPERIVVSSLATDPERQAQLRSAVGSLHGVQLQFEQPEMVRSAADSRRPAEAEGPKPSALLERLTATLGSRNTVENFTNHVMDLSEAALARAAALRSLAVRFPAEVESTLSEADRTVLQGIRATHSKHLLAGVRQLNDVIQPVVKPPQTGAIAFEDWQTGTASVLKAAQDVDRTITNSLAGAGPVEDPDTALRQLAAAAADFNARVAALHTTVAGARP